jgi:hypothetical protein
MTQPFDYEKWEQPIAAYIHGRLSDTDRQAFEQELAQNEDLKAALEFDQLLQKAATTLLLAEAAQLTSVPPRQVPRQSNGGLSRYWFGIVGSLVLIGAIWFWGGGSTYWAQRAAQNWLTVNLQPLELRDFNADGNELLALQAYQQNQFEKAEQWFSQDDSPAKNQNAIRLYRAINALCVKPPQTEKAISILEVRYEHRSPPYKLEAVEWYLLLGYAQKGHWEAALKVAKRIPKESAYFEQAQQFIPLIEKIK